jgi:hypothetical protein
VTLDQLFLGLIALAVVVMAGVQIGAIVLAMRAARRVTDRLDRLEQDVRPIVANAQAMSADAKRAFALASAQVERADRLLTDAARRVEDTVAVVQRSILAPARDGMAIVQGIKAAFTAFRDLKARPRSRTPNIGAVPRAVPDPGDDDHASFIG